MCTTQSPLLDVSAAVAGLVSEVRYLSPLLAGWSDFTAFLLPVDSSVPKESMLLPFSVRPAGSLSMKNFVISSSMARRGDSCSW